jgi:hypothetical protein
MFKAIIPCFICSLLVLHSCRSKTAEKKEPFIDISAYLKGQLAEMDTIPYGFLKIDETDSLPKDSVYLTKKEFTAITQSFLTTDIEPDRFQQDFTETSFADAGLQTVTITYSNINDKNPVQRADIYINPATGEITQLYLVKNVVTTDSSFTQQLVWKHKQYLLLITSRLKANGEEVTKREKIIWL